IGDRIIVRAGDRLPMDGIIISGESELNQAAITGESAWVAKQAGDEVLSGTINGSGLLEVQVTRLVEDTTMQRIIRLVTEAQASKAKQEKFIDKFASIYTPIVMLIAILVVVIPTVFFRQALWNTPHAYGWLHRGLSLLMIGCPCALVISTPVTIISGLTRAARSGVVFKGGVYLEGLSKVKAMAFDKTGTLTRGEPKVELVKAVDCENSDEPCESCDNLLALASALEERSHHPLSSAILEHAEDRGVRGKIAPAEDLKVLAGRGQEGTVNGKKATVGSLPLFLAEHRTPAKLVDETRQAEADGQTTVLVCDGDSVRGYLSLRDQARPEATEVLNALQDLNVHTVMLTGDNAGAAQNIASQLGIHEVKSSLLPHEKLDALELLQETFGTVAMVGDGINDGPALARADIGVAMGGAASAQILETADVVLMNNDLKRLPFALRLSRFTNRLIRQNILVSLGVKFAVAILAILGLTPLWVAVLADIGIALAVTLNGLRATSFEKETI
ncbi:MAG TPA: cation-translocating P-type ATPase, partial [Anaerolineaceae bacterium]|nr:cation-translocating P-type ATPase [Anaerolineaceae bacterium]